MTICSLLKVQSCALSLWLLCCWTTLICNEQCVEQMIFCCIKAFMFACELLIVVEMKAQRPNLTIPLGNWHRSTRDYKYNIFFVLDKDSVKHLCNCGVLVGNFLFLPRVPILLLVPFSFSVCLILAKYSAFCECGFIVVFSPQLRDPSRHIYHLLCPSLATRAKYGRFAGK